MNVSELLCLDSMGHDDIKLYINSPGGNVNDGLAIFDTMNFIKSDVSTICVGEASSMGAILLMNGTKGKRFCLKNSEGYRNWHWSKKNNENKENIKRNYYIKN